MLGNYKISTSKSAVWAKMLVTMEEDMYSFNSEWQQLFDILKLGFAWKSVVQQTEKYMNAWKYDVY